jgi:hypothetical protein
MNRLGVKLLWLLCFAICNPVMAATGSIRGRALDAATRGPLVSATLSIVNGSAGAQSDANGKFLIENLEPGTYHVRGFAYGYEIVTKSEIEVLPHRVTEIEILFGERVFEGQEVTINSGFFAEVQHDMPTSTRSLQYEEVRRAPGGITDVQRIIQALPGVVSEDDQNNEIVVRGGSPSENLTVIDGLELDNISHYGFQDTGGGPVSLLNPEFLREVTFASGGFPAKFGDRASSVLDLELREGSREKHEADLELSMGGAGGLYEGPIAGGKGAVILSARRSYLDAFPQESIGLTAIPEYWDTQGKVTYDFSARHKFTLNALYGNDRIKFEDDDPTAFSGGAEHVKFRGERVFAGARLRSLWGRSYTDIVLGVNSALYHVKVGDAQKDAEGNRAVVPVWLNDSRESVSQASLSWNGSARENDAWSVGAILKPVTLKHSIFTAADTTVLEDGYLEAPNGNPDTLIQEAFRVKENETSSKYGAFAQYTWKPRKSLSFAPGLRYDGFEYSGDHVLGPRFSATWDVRRNVTLTGAYGWYYQSHPFVRYTADPNGANQELPHYHAIQYVLGTRWIPRESSLISVEGYYKTYDGLLISEETLARETEDDWSLRSEKLLPERDKEAYGLEIFFQQKLATNWYGTVSYSFGESKTVDEAYGERPSDYDYRHVMTWVGGYKTSLHRNQGFRNFQKKWYGSWTQILPINGDELTISSRYRYMTGRPFTRKVWHEEGGAAEDPIYEAHWYEEGLNNDRYPDYSRWDIRLDNKHYFGSISLIFFMEMDNILGRPNIASYIYSDDGRRINSYQFQNFFVGGIKVEL